MSPDPATSDSQTAPHDVTVDVPDRRQVRVVAHRGSSGLLPEHTIGAYRRALEEGADGLECDVRLTADDRLVCVHDRRIDRTSDGTGIVSALTFEQLRRQDFGSWKADGGGPAEVLAFDELLELAVDCGRRVELAVETKHPTRASGRVELRTLEALRRFGLLKRPEESPVRIMSFSRLALLRVQRMVPGLPTVFLTEHPLLSGSGARMPGTARIAGPGISLVRSRPGWVARAHRAGYRVHVWTVDRPEDVELCLRLGVDTLITNHPARVLAQLGRGPRA